MSDPTQTLTVSANGKPLTSKEIRTVLYGALNGHEVLSRDAESIVPKVRAKLIEAGWNEVVITRVESNIDDLVEIVPRPRGYRTRIRPGFRRTLADIFSDEG